MTLRFDEAIPTAVSVLQTQLGQHAPRITFVRDATGSLTAVLSDQGIDAAKWRTIATELHRVLAKFSPGENQVLMREADLIAPDDILSSPDLVPVTDRRDIWLVDRMLTNQDWIRKPLRSRFPIPLGVGYSIKGGVGRSTALAMLAWHLARDGRRVLLVDLDLEAPGLAPALLAADLPEYGVVDWCVESLVGQADAQLFAQMRQRSPMAAEAKGSVFVVPAYGTKSADYVAKLGRAYMPSMDREGQLTGLAHRLDSLITCAVRENEPPDVVLLDARAGMHDIGSAAVTQLGAEVFLFARDDAQTWDAYERLFQHLKGSHGVAWGMPEHDLRWRLKMVAAQVEVTEGAFDAFQDRSYSLWTENLYDSEASDSDQPSEGATAQLFERSDRTAPHSPLRVLFDPKVRDLNLLSEKGRPDWQYVEATFGSFLKGAADQLMENEEP